MEPGATNISCQCAHPNQSPSPLIEIVEWEFCECRAVDPNALKLNLESKEYTQAAPLVAA
jgi:hypothetical protein